MTTEGVARPTAHDASSTRRTSAITVGLLMGVFVIDFVDRVMISVALPMLGGELDLTKTQQGLAIAAFSIAYLLGQLPGGYLADRFGSRPMLVASLILWSIFTALTGLVAGLVSLVLVRVLFGFGQALFPAAAFKAISERTTPQVRARANGLMISSNPLGAGLGALIVAPILVAIGWRHTFWVVAVAGVVLGVTLWSLLPRPLPREITDAEAGPRPSGSDRQDERRIFHQVLRSTDIWKFAVLFCAVNMLSYGMIFWVPSYLVDVRGLSLQKVGASAAVPFVVMAMCTYLGGWLFDRYFADRARLLVVPVLGLAAVLIVIMIRADSATEFTVYQTLAMGLAGLSFMSVLGVPVRALPRELIGTSIGVINTGGQLAGAIAPLLMGWLVEEFGYSAAFGLLAGTTVVAALVALIVPQRAADFTIAEKRG